MPKGEKTVRAPIERSAPPVPICENCGAAVDVSGAFCWKCGVPLSTGREPFLPTPSDGVTVPPGAGLTAYPDSSSRSAGFRAPARVRPVAESSIYTARPPRGTPSWAKIAVISLAAVVIVLFFLWLTPFGGSILGRTGAVEITGLAYDPVYQGSATGYFPSGNLGSPCPGGCTLSPAPGSTFELLLLFPNSGSSAHTISAISVAAPFSLASQPASVTVPAGQVWLEELLVVSPSSPGSYSITVSFDTS